MLFNSYTFLIFLVVVLVVSRFCRSWTLRKSFLLIASYVFYAAWNPPFVALLWLSTVVDWWAAASIHKSTSKGTRRLFLILSLSVNLGLLAFFKYGGFALENLNDILSALKAGTTFEKPSIILPVGISFYTFQTLSYTLDIYRGKMKPWPSFLDFALYVTFFPQLVAGPIVRASDFLPQCEEPKVGSKAQISWGLSLLVIGLFSKVVIADALMAPTVDKVFSSAAVAPGFLSAWAGVLAFAIQIFCDFSGYSTCAIGVALCLGFSLPDNFRWPYGATGFSDFWQRWHISLSSWLRDYLYIPLGGNRHGSSRTLMNLITTMLLGGLWHGASWMFVLWGALHGVYLISEHLIKRTAVARLSVWRSHPGRIFLALTTFLAVCMTWVLFRAPNISAATTIFADLFNVTEGLSYVLTKLGYAETYTTKNIIWLGRTTYIVTFTVTTLTICLHYAFREFSIESIFQRLPWWCHSTVLASMAYFISISMVGEERAFIYFQF